MSLPRPKETDVNGKLTFNDIFDISTCPD